MKLEGNAINLPYIYKYNHNVFKDRIGLSYTPQYGGNKVGIAWCTRTNSGGYKECTTGECSTRSVDLCPGWRCDYNI